MYAKPQLSELGTDLIQISLLRVIYSLTLPFMFAAGYFVFWNSEYYIPALGCLVGLSYFSYPSVSHDLLHQAYPLPRKLSFFLLSAIELLCLRSGTAYRAVHLKHHQSFPEHDDVEGNAAHFGIFGALLYGIVFQPLSWIYTYNSHPKLRRNLLIELFLVGCIIFASIWLYPTYPAMAIYCVVIHLGSWIIPFMTSYMPHRANEKEEVHQTRRFRGFLIQGASLNHLYHLEHHMYPTVPHQNWPKLAKRLDPYLDKKRAKVIKFPY